MSDSIWKKEISFKRKPKPDADPDFDVPEAKSEKRSLLKKEISFKRRPRPEADPDFDAPAKQSFLKKEISFKRKAKDAPELPVPLDEPTRESIWKREIGLSRGKQKPADQKTVERLMAEAAAAVAPGTELVPGDPRTVSQPTELAEAIVAAMPDPTVSPPPAPEPVEPAPVAPAPVASVADPAPSPAPVADLHPVEELPVDPAPAPVVPLPSAPVQGLSPQILAASAEQPTVEHEQVVEQWVEPAATPEPEPWLADAELPPAPAAPAPVTVHPPVPAAELPPLDLEPPTPFWKKELSFSRKPKTPKEPKPAGTPFWKQELSLSRAPKEPKEPNAPKPAGAPFWKKELSFSRKPKPAAPVVSEAETAQLPAVSQPPIWKRQVKLSLPSPGKRGHGAKRLVGLKVGASQIAAARVSNNGVAELLQLARDPLAPGVVVAGELRDPEALGDALKAFFARHKLPKKGVRLGIASNRIGVRILDIVGVEEDKQLANAVQFRAQEALPIPLDEAVLDYQVLDQNVDAEGQTVKRVLLVVAYRELIDRYVSACRKAGINLAGIDLEAFALLRALGAPSDRGGSALVAVAIGHDRSTFAVSDGRICEFTRVVEWGGSALNVALARAFDSTPSEVEHIKRELSLDGSTTPEGLSADQVAVALDAVRRQIQSFARELVSSLQFYQNQPGSLGIGEIVLTGGTAQLPGLAHELQSLIGVQVRVGDPLARLKVAKKAATFDQVGSLAVAIGLGIED
jgi:type IV pilus assembly protein PilM